MEPFPHEVKLQVRVEPRRWAPWTGTVVLDADVVVRWVPGESVVAEVDPASLRPADPQLASWVAPRLASVRPAGPIRFESRRIGSVTVSGELTCNGVTRTVRVQLRDEHRWRRAECVLLLPEFGLTGYRGRSGAFASRDQVTVDILTDWGARGADWVEKPRG